MKKCILPFLAFFFVAPLWSQNDATEILATEEASIVPLESIHTIDCQIFTPDELSLEKRNIPNLALHKKDPIVAWILSFPLGMLGAHRAYLGAGPQMMAWYVLSFGGVFGIIPMVDWIFLLKSIQKNDMSPYVGNKKWIMWL